MSGPIYPEARAEVDYYGPTVPTSPTNGETWRETTAAGKLIEEWVWENSLSKWISANNDRNCINVFLGGSGTFNCPVFASPGAWAFRVRLQAAPGNATDTWSMNLRHGGLQVAGGVAYTSIATFDSVANTFFDFESPWYELSDTYAINIPTTRVGSASLAGALSVERRKIRAS